MNHDFKGTAKLILIYKTDGKKICKVSGYYDSYFGGDLDKRRSISSYIFTIGGNTISWKSSLQRVVALSSTEAEYIALTEATKEAMWLEEMLVEIGCEQRYVDVFCDSQSAIHLTKNSMYHERKKHNDIRLHFIKDVIEEGLVQVEKISTDVNPVALLTKVIPVTMFNEALKF